MSPNQSVNIQITDGPSADKAFDALKYTFDKTVKMEPWFEIFLNAKSPAPYTSLMSKKTRILARQVTGIRYESEASGMLLITMRTLDGTYEAFYNANTRKGSMRKIS